MSGARRGPGRRTPKISSPLARAVLAVSSATLGAQVLTLVASPIISRLFTPAEFGSYFIVYSTSLALAAGLALRLELAIPIPEEPAQAKQLAVYGLFAVLGLSAVGLVLLTLLSVTGALGQIDPIILTAPVVAASVAVFSLLNAIALREMKFSAVAKRQLVVAAVTVVAQVGAGHLGLGALGLVGATVLGQLSGIFTLLRHVSLLKFPDSLRRSERVALIRRFKRFPLLLAPAGWMNSLGVNLPVILLGALYSTQAAGWFGLTQRIVALPVALLGSSIAQVFVGEMARLRRDQLGGERAIFLRFTAVLGLIAGVTLALLLTVAPWLFTTVFGEAWRTSGEMARVFAAAVAAQIVVSPLSQTLVIFERTVAQFLWDAARLALIATAVTVAWSAGASPVVAVSVLAAASVVAYLGNWLLCFATVTRGEAPQV